ncbi:MAG: hypothetical protein ACTJHU_00950 [Mycetocola sp.]
MISTTLDTPELVVVASTAVPTPVPTVDPKDVTPGPVGFAAIFIVAVLAILLIVDMARRVRRVEYRNRVSEDRAAASSPADASSPTAGSSAPQASESTDESGTDNNTDGPVSR